MNDLADATRSQEAMARLREQMAEGEDSRAAAAAEHDGALLSAASEVAGVCRTLCEALPQLCTPDVAAASLEPPLHSRGCIEHQALLHLQVPFPATPPASCLLQSHAELHVLQCHQIALSMGRASDLKAWCRSTA